MTAVGELRSMRFYRSIVLRNERGIFRSYVRVDNSIPRNANIRYGANPQHLLDLLVKLSVQFAAFFEVASGRSERLNVPPVILVAGWQWVFEVGEPRGERFVKQNLPA